MRVAGSSGSPGNQRPAAVRTASISASFRLLWTSTRLPAEHISPWLKKMPPATARAACSRSGQSARISCGDLPPSSSQVRLRLLAAAQPAICRPTAVEPVKATQSMSMCAASRRPVSPAPGSTCNTPSGRPASAASAASRMAVSGDFSLGLRMTLLPAASAGAIFHDAISSGKFHGTMAATTPTGSRVTSPSRAGSSGATSPLHLSTASAYQANV